MRAAQHTERDGQRGGNMSLVDGAGVGVHATRQVDGHPRDAGPGQVGDDPVRGAAQRATAAQAHHAVNSHVRGRTV